MINKFPSFVLQQTFEFFTFIDATERLSEDAEGREVILPQWQLATGAILDQW